jgi:class 3 adenylate cyclase/pimeloyl-ACP methyl ester carboxylesterase
VAVSHIPPTQYVQSGDFHVAYQVTGDGPVDLIYVPGWVSQLELYWDEPSLARFLRRLASFSRLIIFDKRGIGLSDRVSLGELPTLEERMDDIRAVLDAAGSTRAAVVAQGYATPMASLFAATYPDRTASLVLYSACGRGTLRTDDYPWGATAEEFAEWTTASTRGDAGFAATWLRRLAPTVADDDRVVAWTGRVLRASASPSAYRGYTEMQAVMDVREVLPLIRVPTLVLERADAWLPKGPVDMPPVEEGRWVAEQIPGAKLVVVPGRDYLPWFGDQESLLAEIEQFVTGSRHPVEANRVLLTVLFTDIVGSTIRADALGDRRWSALLDEHNALMRRQLERYRGREIDRAGDGFFATFDGPARAVRCVLAMTEEARAIGIEIRAGVHTGEVELSAEGVAGIAVHIGARTAALAGPGEVLVTRTVKDLVGGSGLIFDSRGAHELRGVPEPWELYLAVGQQS